MSMQAETTSKQRGWCIDTDSGTWFVPGDAQPVPAFIATEQPITADDGVLGSDLLYSLGQLLRDYIEPGWHRVQSIEVVEGYFGRMTMPGYLDCTEWTFRRAQADLREALSIYSEE